MRAARVPVLALGVLTACASQARADATLFVGSTTTTAARPARGVAFGGGILVVGFEFEYSDTRDDGDHIVSYRAE